MMENDKQERKGKDQPLFADQTEWITDEWLANLIDLRRDLHRKPELSGQEEQTAARLRSIMEDELGLSIVEVAGTHAFCAVMEGGKVSADTRANSDTRANADGQAVVKCYRADMDALAIQEKNLGSYVSLHDGIMHACGHDLHMAAVVGLARILKQRQAELSGRYVFLFQHSEETGHGAEEVLRSAVLQNLAVSQIYAGHVWDCPTGQVICREHEVLAASDTFQITVRGKGGHGAMPQHTRDPITAACQMILAFQVLAARRHSPFAPLTLSVCRIHGGSSYNIVPDDLYLEGNIRSFDPELRRNFLSELHQTAQATAAAFGTTCEMSLLPGPPSTVNDSRLAKEIQRRLRLSDRIELLTEAELHPGMVSEDFAFYLEKIPGLFFLFGASNPSKGCSSILHQSDFMPDEAVLAVMLETYLATI